MKKNIKDIFSIDKEKLKSSFVYTYIIGLIAHGYAYANFQPSHDSLNEIVSNSAYYSWKLQLGRFLKPFYDYLFGYFNSLPWSSGILSLFWISISVYFVCQLLEFNKKYQIVIICGILTTNITVISLTATYFHDLSSDMCALALSTMASYVWDRCASREGKTVKDCALYVAIMSLCLIMSLSLYQAYICIFTSLILMKSIARCVNSKECKIREIWKSCFCAVLSLLIVSVVYYIGLKLMPFITGVYMKQGEYNSVSNLWQNKEPPIDRIKFCFDQYVTTLLKMPGYSYSSKLPQIINIVIILISMFCLLFFSVQIMNREKDIKRILSIAVFCVLLPFSMNGMRLLNETTHQLMIFGIWLTYIFAYNLCVNFTKTKLINAIGTILLSFLILMNIQTANTCYVKKTTEQKATLSLMTRVIERIESLDGYKEGETPVVFIGFPSYYLESYNPFNEISSITGMGENSAITSYSQYGIYINMFMRVPINIVDLEVVNEEIDEENISAMDSFPSTGSVQMINGIVIVKF